MEYTLDNKAIADALWYRLRTCEDVCSHYATLCSRDYRGNMKGWDIWLNKCISYQKEWLRIRKALNYMIHDINGDTCGHHKNPDAFINEVIRIYGKDAEKEFKNYTFECGSLVFQVIDNVEYELDRDLIIRINEEVFDDDDEEFEYEWEGTRRIISPMKIMTPLEVRKSIVEIMMKMIERGGITMRKSPKKH